MNSFNRHGTIVALFLPRDPLLGCRICEPGSRVECPARPRLPSPGPVVIKKIMSPCSTWQGRWADAQLDRGDEPMLNLTGAMSRCSTWQGRWAPAQLDRGDEPMLNLTGAMSRCSTWQGRWADAQLERGDEPMLNLTGAMSRWSREKEPIYVHTKEGTRVPSLNTGGLLV